MPKPKARKAPSPAPSAEQVAGVRRAADAGDLPQACKRLAALRKSFPGFKPLLGLAWEIENRHGHAMLAAARAWEWQRTVPGSRAAVEALCQSAGAAGLSALLTGALQRLNAFDGRNAPPPGDSLDSPLGPLSLAQAQALDLSRMHLADDDPLQAIAVLKDVDHPSARNNLAVALFCHGDVAQARAVMEANWQAEPANLFALERALRWRCWAEGLERCAGFAATLSAAQPRRPDDAIAQVAALRFLDDPHAAQEAWNDSSTAAYWHHASADQRAIFDTLDDAANELPGGDAAWFPRPWMRAVTAAAWEKKDGNGHDPDALWDAQLDACDAHADYLARAAELGNAAVRMLALMVLKQRARRGDGAATAQLRTLLKRPHGPDSVRMDLLHWLADHGLRDREEPVDVWLTGSLRTIQTRGIRITDEAQPPPFPPVGAALNERVHQAIVRGDIQGALTLAQQLGEMHPEQPSALANLAGIKEGPGHPREEIAALYRQALALDPDYLFARCGLARCLAEEKRIEEAAALLKGLIERTEWHRSEYRSFLLTQRALALAGGEPGAAWAAEEALEELDHGGPD